MNSEQANNPKNPSLGAAASSIEQDLQQGLDLCAQKKWRQAASCFEAVITANRGHAIAWNNLGNVLDELGDWAGAYAAFQAALALSPDYASPKKNWAIIAYKYGLAQYAAGKLQAALAAFQIATQQMPNQADYAHSYLQLLLETCEHTSVQAHVQTMRAHTQADESYYPHPYPLLAAVDDPQWHQIAARRHVARLCNEVHDAHPDSFASIAASPKNERIRLAYLSSDWHQHPVPQQLISSIELHDRTQFEVIGIATDIVPDVTPWRARIEGAFDQFFALGDLTDAHIATHLKAMDIDVAIDLSLYMDGGRPLILASRPCRVQVAFLGYAGTSGAPWIDYLIADEVVIPQSHAQFYSEKIMRLPRSFMPDHDQRPQVRILQGRAQSLIQQGLPADGFVFCAFSNPYKITPEMLACWFGILQAVPESVLWLQANNEVAQQNIKTAAVQAGLAAKRLVFAKRVDSFDEHLQRYELADLFLDSFPYNAHVTAADSLWAELPVLTLQGQSFASRVASSLLLALDLQELITYDMPSYQARALELAKQPAQLQALREKLARSKAGGRYFNQAEYVRGLEGALREVSHFSYSLPPFL